MKKSLLIFMVAAVFTLCTTMGYAKPKAVFVNPTFEFSPLAEGQGITHEFVVKNLGDTPLNILSVIPP
ncbi:MAG: hypothetical protein HUK40_00265 [Desulfobacter sp.]|nr:hypothetical protein [Desulfobacter sp.]